MYAIHYIFCMGYKCFHPAIYTKKRMIYCFGPIFIERDSGNQTFLKYKIHYRHLKNDSMSRQEKSHKESDPYFFIFKTLP